MGSLSAWGSVLLDRSHANEVGFGSRQKFEQMVSDLEVAKLKD